MASLGFDVPPWRRASALLAFRIHIISQLPRRAECPLYCPLCPQMQIKMLTRKLLDMSAKDGDDAAAMPSETHHSSSHKHGGKASGRSESAHGGEHAASLAGGDGTHSAPSVDTKVPLSPKLNALSISCSPCSSSPASPAFGPTPGSVTRSFPHQRHSAGNIGFTLGARIHSSMSVNSYDSLPVPHESSGHGLSFLHSGGVLSGSNSVRTSVCTSPADSLHGGDYGHHQSRFRDVVSSCSSSRGGSRAASRASSPVTSKAASHADSPRTGANSPSAASPTDQFEEHMPVVSVRTVKASPGMVSYSSTDSLLNVLREDYASHDARHDAMPAPQVISVPVSGVNVSRLSEIWSANPESESAQAAVPRPFPGGPGQGATPSTSAEGFPMAINSWRRSAGPQHSPPDYSGSVRGVALSLCCGDAVCHCTLTLWSPSLCSCRPWRCPRTWSTRLLTSASTLCCCP